jgi:hypothetical protein
MSLSNAIRQAQYRARRKLLGLPRPDLAAHKRVESERRIMRRRERPFVGVDGEGAGTDALGRQNYYLMRAGGQELFTGKPLTTVECLEFILSLPATDDAILVSFSFGYDVTMILRDLPSERRRFLLAPKVRGGVGYTYWCGPPTRETNRIWWKNEAYGIDYLPKNHFRVCRAYRHDHEDWGKPVEGTARTIYETFGFFQKSFVNSLNSFDIGTPGQREEIQRNKDERGDVEIGDQQRDYCALECDLLAQMMTKFRDNCIDADVIPRTWNGAGKLSSALHKRNGTLTSAELADLVPTGCLIMANMAYFGGRFEITRAGLVPGPIHEYDIHSAYPSMMLYLPCLRHAGFQQVDAAWMNAAGPDEMFVGSVRFRHKSTTLCGLPIRQKTGSICWPVRGGGVYWSVEVESAKALGCTPTYQGTGWRIVKRCDCQPFAWVERVYETRRALGNDGAGYPLKLATAGLYGKLAQRIGSPMYSNLVWAGLITASTRALLNRACALDPGAVVMIATDGIFSLRPLDLPLSDVLGDWEHQEHERLFLVQPGIYWGAGRPKTRGVSSGRLADHMGAFERAWTNYAELDHAALSGLTAPPAPPVVQVPITLFTGLKIAQARGKPDTAGIWVRGDTDPPMPGSLRRFDMDWAGKRGPHTWSNDRSHVVTAPKPGSPSTRSLPHRGLTDEMLAAMDLGHGETEEQPDLLDLSFDG